METRPYRVGVSVSSILMQRWTNERPVRFTGIFIAGVVSNVNDDDLSTQSCDGTTY